MQKNYQAPVCDKMKKVPGLSILRKEQKRCFLMSEVKSEKQIGALEKSQFPAHTNLQASSYKNILQWDGCKSNRITNKIGC